MNDQKTAIKARGLRKTFGSVVAVDGIDIDGRAGEIYGFLGPNGAGKTTTIKLLTGVLTPDEGEIEILGENLHDNELAIKRQIGVVPDEPPKLPYIKGREFIEFIASIYRCDKSCWHRLDELCELLKIDYLDGFIDDYSHGMRQKLIVASVLMRKPKVLFLDEPTTGLDPYSARGLKMILRRMADEGAAIFFTTHILEIAEKICDRISVIVSGRIVATGSMDELRKKAGVSGDLEQVFMQITGADEDEIARIVDAL